MDAVAALAPEPSVIAAACAALGLSRASLHRRGAAVTRPPATVRRRPKPARALGGDERQGVVDLLREPRFVDQAPAEVYASLLDEGFYHCSIRTMYRILHGHGAVKERRRRALHTAGSFLGDFPTPDGVRNSSRKRNGRFGRSRENCGRWSIAGRTACFDRLRTLASARKSRDVK